MTHRPTAEEFTELTAKYNEIKDLLFEATADAADAAQAAARHIAELSAQVEDLGQQVIHLYGQIQDGITTQIRQAASRWLTELRKLLD